MFTLQQANKHSVCFKKENRFPPGIERFNTGYVGVRNLPTAFSRSSAYITDSKKVFIDPTVTGRASNNPSSADYRLDKPINDYFHGRSFTTERKFDTTKYIPGLRIKDIR